MSDSDSNTCGICCEDYNISSRARIKCPSCQFDSCRTCIRTYLLSNNDEPHCMKCKNGWDRDMLIEATLGSFVNKQYKEHQKKIMFETEKSRLSETMPAVEKYKTCVKLAHESNILGDQINELQRQTALLKGKQGKIYAEIFRNENGDAPKNKRKFIKACPAYDCRGFLSSQYKCALCDTQVCSKCFVIKLVVLNGVPLEHECNESDLQSANMIRKETRNCPTCAVSIYKTEGCDQMWCTQCHTPFSWKTGLKVTGVVHNPHFYAWQNKGGGEARVNVPGAVMCGGLPHLYQYRTAIGRTSVTAWSTLTRPEWDSIEDDAIKLHRAASHFQHVELERIRTICNINIDNGDLRVKYIMKEINEADMMNEIYKRKKKRDKVTAMLQIYELVNTVFTEGIRDIYMGMLNLESYVMNTDEESKNGDSVTPQDIIKYNIKRCHALREYANTQLTKISVMYSQSVAFIQPDFYIVGRKYRKSDIVE